ncbi:MAG: triose-phosphate isomerase [Crocinitomicaceae bacterium]|nr:triose-phosphate isomerase [Crocinitomicaceae bacterium]
MKNIVAGNWKSNKLLQEALELINGVKSGLANELSTEVIIAPPAPYLSIIANHSGEVLQIASQQCSATGSGAFTGEFTAGMLASCNVNWVIIGHSERREGYGETNDAVRNKLHVALDAGLQVLLCCGESLEVRELGTHFDWVKGQLLHALEGLSAASMEGVVIAYEPIWAIGTGKTASTEQAQEMHAFIRSWLVKRFDETIAQGCRILYGGSCKPNNAEELFAQPDVNGGLIGGASLNASDFLDIVAAAEKH